MGGFAASSPAGWLRIAEPDRLFRAAYALCGSPGDAEELVLETFARVRSRRRFARRGGDAVHLMRELHRSWTGRQRPATSGPEEPTAWAVDRSGDPHVLTLDVQRAYGAIAELPHEQRAAIAAVDVLGLSHRDAARALRIRRRNLTSRLYDARERVAAALQETP